MAHTKPTLLTRDQAAKYLGYNSKEAIRYWERAGQLPPGKKGEKRGYTMAQLDAIKQKREAVGARTLSEAEMAEEIEETRHQRDVRRQDAALGRRYDSIFERAQRSADAEDRARKNVDEKNEHKRVAFLAAHVTGQAALEAVTSGLQGARVELSALVTKAWLAPIPSPKELYIDYDGNEVEGSSDLVRGGPFFAREGPSGVLACQERLIAETTREVESRPLPSHRAVAESGGPITLFNALLALIIAQSIRNAGPVSPGAR